MDEEQIVRIAIAMDSCMNKMKEALQELAEAFSCNAPSLQNVSEYLQEQGEEVCFGDEDKLTWVYKVHHSNVSKQYINASVKHSAINRRAVIRCRNNCH